ncbi:AAA family ATPase [Chryseolinea lacunae]|uniref:AAA family ATPase n=1 Tax=Chryseolinea lacunae TaxID=2801331 RepID=A0ABS1KS07_9BACT|nr:AAA family ATPase [Chryseolinea lacunae]MBL0742037.1 AAA family ATPase [Chryseolinea lacunae]
MKWTLTKYRAWDDLEKMFPWVNDMKHIPQDAIHHTEGNVAIHTQMVLEALLSFPAYRNLDEQQQELLWASALLHDVEKRSTTVTEDDGRITSRGHARKGENTARQILFQDIPTPFALREHIASLVRYHGLPLWVLEKTNPQKTLLEASLNVDMKALALLARADATGRICRDQSKLLERIDFFEAYCQEQGCWQTPKKFPSALARFHYFQKEEASPDYDPFDDLKGKVIMLSGLPGMGKDRYIQKHYSDLPMLSLDNIRREHKLKPDDASATGWAVQQAKEQAKIYLRKGQPFVWNATNITRQMRTQWVDLFVQYKAHVTIVYLEVPYKEWLKQNSDREHVVPAHVLQRLMNKLEVPRLDEAHEVEYVV